MKMYRVESPNGSELIPMQRGRKRWKSVGTGQPFAAEIAFFAVLHT
jgi:hypothetical protein